VRLALVHNPTAGHGVYTAGDLVRLLRTHGTVDVFGRDRDALHRAIAARPDVLVVAGGDGTVARAAIALRDLPIPLYILPTGTANNVARAVGSDGPISVLATHVSDAVHPARLDVGRIIGDDREQYFVEAAGIGFIGELLDEERRALLQLWRRARSLVTRRVDRWHRARRGIAGAVRRLPARWLAVRADDEDLSGDYIAAEVMNIAAIGPRICLAPAADPGDSQFDLVLVRPADRDALADYIISQGSGDVPSPIAARRVTRVEIDWPKRATHVDDEPWPRRGQRPHRVTIDIAGATRLLVPARRPAE
jgi:diacylglycerol kinase family enzyme